LSTAALAATLAADFFASSTASTSALSAAAALTVAAEAAEAADAALAAAVDGELTTVEAAIIAPVDAVDESTLPSHNDTATSDIVLATLLAICLSRKCCSLFLSRPISSKTNGFKIDLTGLAGLAGLTDESV
jgi:hypothetical protein